MPSLPDATCSLLPRRGTAGFAYAFQEKANDRLAYKVRLDKTKQASHFVNALPI
ncbi:hypothetical protein [Nostoc sp. LPT]|uniref:hypothetical protein n=1 Tax=Nostoc sp. LPT TaxID=2815387 RepID=UPI001D6870EF|nr:hypothetical protein [Nostoc sp. LPT]MBN4005033.1 hypothetical protein [Nostoc sp. LPT]